MQSSFYVLTTILLVHIGFIDSTYNAFTYDDGSNNAENCCLVRLDKDFCLAQPLTRSLLQVSKKCHRLAAHEKETDYLNRVVRRINVEVTHEVGDKVLVELKSPLEKKLLQKDLLCLSPKNNNINLEKCFVELEPKKPKKTKPKRSSKGSKEAVNDTAEEVIVEKLPSEDAEVLILEVADQIYIHEGHGLGVHDYYDLNLTEFKASNNKQRKCWNWYRALTRSLCSNPYKHKDTCVALTEELEICLSYLFQRQIPDGLPESYSRSINVGSKLYCEDLNQRTRYLGYHRHAEICFLTNLQISVQYRFTDDLSVSDPKTNKDILAFIAKDDELSKEFEADCRDKTTLDEIKKALEKEAEQKRLEAEQAAAEAEPQPESEE